MIKKLRPSVLVIMTAVVMVGLSFVPTQGNRAAHTVRANHQSYVLHLSRQNGIWCVNHEPSGDLTVAVPPHTSLQLVTTEQAPAVKFIQLTPVYPQMGKQSLVFSEGSEKSGVQIDGRQISLGKYKCKVKVAGETKPVIFELAVTPAVPQPQLAIS